MFSPFQTPLPVPHCCFVASAGFPILWGMGELSRGDQARLASERRLPLVSVNCLGCQDRCLLRPSLSPTCLSQWANLQRRDSLLGVKVSPFKMHVLTHLVNRTCTLEYH